jgi:hypothetical protein
MPLTLLPASFLVLFGFGLFALGHVTDYTGVAVIGGVIVVGVGAGIVTQGGLDHKVGETRTITNETANQTVVDVEPEYRPVGTPNRLPLGFVTMLAGSLLAFQPLAQTVN